MKLPISAAAVAFSLSFAFAAQAQDGAALATSKGCGACHAVDQKKVGPSYKDIAAKYAAQANAEPTISTKLKNGQGHMKVAATDAEVKSMVNYILAQK
jgi:cytochrome c